MVKNVWGLHLTITRIFLTGTTTVRAHPKQLIRSMRAPKWREHKIFALQPSGCRSGGLPTVPVCPGLCSAEPLPAPSGAPGEKRWAEEAEIGKRRHFPWQTSHKNTQKSLVCPFCRALGTSAAPLSAGEGRSRLPRAGPAEDTCPAGRMPAPHPVSLPAGDSGAPVAAPAASFPAEQSPRVSGRAARRAPPS